MSTVLQPDRSPSLLVVIVNYRTAQLTVNCLRSLASEVQALPGTRVVVVDNASGDDSVAAISGAIAAAGWGDWATLVPSDRNGGFAYGNNLAIRPALNAANSPAYYLLLNPDTEVRPNALKALLEFMEQHPEVGISGSGLEEAEGTPWSIAFRFPSIWSEIDDGFRLGIVSKLLAKWVVAQQMGDRPQQVDWLPGASMMIRRQVFDAIGLMDEAYFLYYEETDFCLAARRAGWSCWYVPQSRVMHISGQSTGVTGKRDVPKRRPQYVFDSRRRYFVKNYGLVYAALADAVWIVGFTLWRWRRAIFRKPDYDPPHFLWDFLRNSVFVQGPNLGKGST